MKHSSFSVYIEQDEDSVFIGSIPLIPSCYAQGDTEEEMLRNLQEVLKLCLRNIDKDSLEKTRFVGIHNVDTHGQARGTVLKYKLRLT